MLSVTERDEDLKLTQGLLVCVEIKGVGLLGTSQTAVPVVFLFESRGSHLGISVCHTGDAPGSEWVGARDAVPNPIVPKTALTVNDLTSVSAALSGEILD